jgi:hypothetical protein
MTPDEIKQLYGTAPLIKPDNRLVIYTHQPSETETPKEPYRRKSTIRILLEDPAIVFWGLYLLLLAIAIWRLC